MECNSCNSDNLQEKQISDFWAYYNEYLKTQAWQDKRNAVLKRDNYICQGCLKNKAIHVHHTTYDNIYDELLFQLISLCIDCHSKLYPDKNL